MSAADAVSRFARFITGRPRAVLLAVLLATVYLGYGLTKLRTRNNQDSELPKDDPIVATNDRLKAVFGDKAVILIGVEAPDIYTPGTLRKVAEISAALRRVDGVIAGEIRSLSTVRNVQDREWGLEVRHMLDSIPRSPEALRRLRAEVHANHLLRGQLVSEDGTLALVQASVEAGFDQKQVYRDVARIVAAAKGPERVYVAGDAIQSEAIDRGIQQDVSRLLPAVLLLTLLGYYISFRTWRGVWVPFCVTLLSVVWTMGLMGHVGLALTVVSSAVPILMVAVSSSYGIHVVHWYYEAVKRGAPSPAYAGLVQVTPSILLVGIISVIGSASLGTFRVASIREFGIITALGGLATIAAALTFAPAVLAALAPRRLAEGSGRRLDERLAPVAVFAVRRRRSVLAGAAVLLAVSAVGVSRLEIGTDFVQYFPADHPLRTSFEAFNRHLGGARRMEVMIEGPAADAIKEPALLRQVEAFQRYAERFPEVGRTSSFADVVRRINREMHGGDPAYNAIPGSRDLVAQYLLLSAMAGDAGNLTDVVDHEYRRAKVQVMLTTSEQRDHRRLYEAFRRYAAEHMGPGVRVEFGGDVMFWLAQIHHIAVGKVYNVVTGVGFVLLLCALVFRSASAGWFGIAPLALATATTFGLMGFAGIRLETGTAIITSIALGVGVDFSLHYLVHFRDELRQRAGRPVDLEEVATHVFLTGGKPILFDMLSNMLGFAVLTASGFMPIRYFGWLVSLTMLTVGVGTLLIMPALVATWRPRFLLGRAAAAPVAPQPAPAMLTASKIVTSSALLLAVLVPARAAVAQAPTGRQLIERNDAMQAVDDERVTFAMTLVDRRGQQRAREVSWVVKNDAGGGRKRLIQFGAPADVRGTALLAVEHATRDDDQWLYLPALRRSRRISAAGRSDSFVGSDFAYEDLGREEMQHYEYRLLRQAPDEGAPAYVVEAVPTSAERRQESAYGRREIWVRADNHVVTRVDFFDKDGRLVKVFRASDVRPVASSRSWRAHRMEMRDQRTGHVTVLTFGPFAVNTGVGEDTFSLRALERGP